MVTGRGAESIAGVGAETTWGTAVVATQKIRLISESITQRYDHVADLSLVGVADPGKTAQGTRIAEGAFVYEFDYGQSDVLMTHFFGLRTTGPPAHYDFQDNIDDDSLTFAVDKQVSVHEFAGWKISQVVMSGNPADGIRIEATGIGQSRDLGSAVNTSGALAALSAPAARALFQELTLSINALGSALTAYAVSDFSLTLNRNLDAPAVNATNRLQALDNGFHSGELSITVPRYTTDQFLTWHDAHTMLFAKLVMTDGTNTKDWRINKMAVTDAPPNVSGPELMPVTITFELFNDTANENTDADFAFTEMVRLFES